jgi:hypothetical protein
MKFMTQKKFFLRTAMAVTLAASMGATGWTQSESAQDKATPLSKVERLNRAPVSKDVLKVTFYRTESTS